MTKAITAGAIDQLREALVAAGRRLGARGLISAGEGNLSVRIGDGRLLVTPTGLRKDELVPEDLLVVGPDGVADGPGRRGLRPTSDLAIHLAIHAARPDVLAVAHAHLPSAMALTLAGERADPAALPETALLLPRLPFVPFGQPGSTELATRIAAALTEPPEPLPGAALLERHGAVAVGGRLVFRGRVPADAASAGSEDGTGVGVAAVRQALDRLELVEVLCRATLDALLIRAARGAPAAEA